MTTNKLWSEFPTMNAAGPLATSKKDLSILYHNPNINTVVTKTVTLESKGRPEDLPKRWKIVDNTSYNNVGLINDGLQYFLECFRLLKQSATQQKPLILSLDPDYDVNNKFIDPKIFQLVRQYAKYIDAIELNFTCPNRDNRDSVIWNGPNLHAALDLIVTRLRDTDIRLGLKLPVCIHPRDFFWLEASLDCLRTTPHIWDRIEYLVCCNTIPRGLVFSRSAFIGAVGGTTLKPIALYNVHHFSKRYKDKIIVGCGGISNHKDVEDYKRAGAGGIQVCTAWLRCGVSKL